MYRLLLCALLVLASCGGESGPPPRAGGPASGPPVAAEVAIARARCLACHPAVSAAAVRLDPLPSPRLRGIGSRVAGPWLEDFLAGHFAADDEQAIDLAHFVRGAFGAAALAPAAVGAAEIERGGRLWEEAGCLACHGDAPDAPAGGSAVTGIPGLDAKTDLDHLFGFLRAPLTTRPDLRAHDFGLDGADAHALAAWLLRARRVDASAAPLAPGIAWECFELPIEDAGLPELDGLEPKAVGRADTIDVSPRTRDNNFALRFTGSVLVPDAGDWTFVVGSDDSSWLYVDGEMVVRNEALAPHRRREGRVELAAGWHEFAVVYTEAGGGQSLEVLWEGPGVERSPIPAAALSAQSETLLPPDSDATLEPPRVQRGELAFVAQRCGACHREDGLPVPSAATAWATAATSDRSCPVVELPAVAIPALRPAAGGTRSPAEELRFLLHRDGCLQCHARDGEGGIGVAARERLVETEDLGDEGRVPPDLSHAGHRLREDWIWEVLTGERDARSYMKARMPRVSSEEAAYYASLFETADAVPGDDVEPTFSAEAAAEGRRIAGNDGFVCIACHRVAGHASTGPQGMDLAIQNQRLKPRWFREWLLTPATHRPGTRMPSFWPVENAAAIAQVDAVRVWLSLGNAMPLPKGVGSSGSDYVLEADGDRPRLHGAFLKDLSARCIAVGTPERTHYAYDLAHLRLAWLWRGAFLDAKGTWDGRAGQLLTPAGEDWVTLPEGCSFAPLADGDVTPRMLGWGVGDDGYPTWRVALGAVEVEDHPRPRWSEQGSELVRTVSARGGAVRMILPATGGPVQAFVDGKVVSEVRVDDGAVIDVVYRW